MNSRHLPGHAVDLAALAGGELSWQWEDYFRVAAAMQAAAHELAVPVCWAAAGTRSWQPAAALQGGWQFSGSQVLDEAHVRSFAFGAGLVRRHGRTLERQTLSACWAVDGPCAQSVERRK